MTRAMNVTLPESDVAQSCKTAKVAISAIETLPSGGTRLVCVTIEDADKMRKRLKKHLIDGAVTRYRFYRPPGAEGGY